MKDTLVNIERLRFSDRDIELASLLTLSLPAYGIGTDFLFAPIFYRLRYAGAVPTDALAGNPDVATCIDVHLADFLGSRSNGAMAHFVIYGALEGRAAFDLSRQAVSLNYSTASP